VGRACATAQVQAPGTLVAGAALQCVVMPALALAAAAVTVWVVGPGEAATEAMLGLLLVSCCPAGAVATLTTFLARGNAVRVFLLLGEGRFATLPLAPRVFACEH